MMWILNKKKLPIAMVGVLAVICLVVMTGCGGDSEEATSDASTTDMPSSTAVSSGMPGATPAGMPGTTPSTPTNVTVPGAEGSQTDGTQIAQEPTPNQEWREDPFATDTGSKKPSKPPVQRLEIPMLGRIFSPPPPPAPASAGQTVVPEPPRRVAGILYGDRVNALIQTHNGFETVKPGDRLIDGTIVERIERDRVILRPVTGPSRTVEIRLAASVVPLEPPTTTTPSGSSGRPGYPGPGGGGRPGGLRPPGM